MANLHYPAPSAPRTCRIQLPNVEIIPASYQEDLSFLCTGAQEPSSRSLYLVFRSEPSQWRVKVTFKGTLLGTEETPSPGRLQRELDLRTLASNIRFDTLPLLHDTVTELEITVASTNTSLELPLASVIGGAFAPVVEKLRYSVQEDKSRVHYPLWRKDISQLHKPWSEVKLKKEITPCAHLAYVGAKGPYIYKDIERSFYHPRDSDVLQQEIRHLELFRGISTIIQPIAVVISKNPYQTVPSKDGPLVIRGVLLEFHPGGTLEDVLKRLSDDSTIPWRKWPFQIAESIRQLHENDITHMDLKPSNIVISKDGDAVLIDISGIGGVTHEWLAPEIREIFDPLPLPLVDRKRNDVWAFGKILSQMAQYIQEGWEKQLLQVVAAGTSQEDPALRISLSLASSKLHRLSECA